MDWSKPTEITDAQLAFPANVIGTLLPVKDEIPKEFFGSTPYGTLAHELFYRGFVEKSDLQLREGLYPEKVHRHISACLGSYEPKHEHKMAGVAYLLSLWFEPIT